MCPMDMEKPPAGKQPQAAEPSDFDADLVAVFVVLALADELEDVDEDESEDEPPDSLEDAGVLVVPELLREPLPEWLLVPRRESLRESLR